MRRYAEHGFTPVRRYAEHGFTPVRRYAEHGFTLIEMMISLLIFGMLSAAGAALLSFSVRAQGVTGAKLDDVGALNRLSSALSADLAQASFRATRNEAGDMLPAFTGESGSGPSPMLRLVRGGWSNLDQARRAGEQKVEYRLANGNMERIVYPMLDGAEPLAPSVLLADVREVALRYRVNGAWSDTWQGSAQAPLPQVLEMRLVRGNGIEFRQLFLVGAGYAPKVLEK
ncbi:type II secretion system minor pseudopilin GspJ [Sphingomonas sp. So64.6b]|uniref:type II secretion system minor pseudopilin GspJ n=1 Tax=Sphingomonas sp. So64.6b TaxID=2997354 RepID=UPI0016019E19|nr:type II secretion system minor pseudopilin GspJ [Sphingomonas sp. So64.6b]QNA84109.1 type II secretion system minor pseudopilin GspJ [Sphingomonas sp. So64.6b]